MAILMLETVLPILKLPSPKLEMADSILKPAMCSTAPACI